MLEALAIELVAGGIWLYYQCSWFMVNVADMLGITYRDANAGLFFLVWPTVTAALVLWVLWNQLTIWRLSRS